MILIELVKRSKVNNERFDTHGLNLVFAMFAPDALVEKA